MHLTTFALALSLFCGPLLASPSTAQGGPPQPPPPPPSNPITPAKTLLGKALFWDEQLSSGGTSACATCHIPSAGGQDPRSAGNPASRHPGFDGLLGTPDDIAGSIGVMESAADGSYLSNTDFGLQRQVTGRQAPTMINAAFFNGALFWDGRASGRFEDPITGQVIDPFGAALESQAAAPPSSSVEMGHVGVDWLDIAQRVALFSPLDLAEIQPGDLADFVAGHDYPELFNLAFGSPAVTPVRIIQAIATYERSLISLESPFDAFLGGNPGALTPQQQAGLAIFNGPGRCVACHGGPVNSDGLFHYIGVRPTIEDEGRFNVTGNPADRGSMKTPSLRNVELSGPYFHNGAFATLNDVVNFYDRGGDFNAPNKDPRIAPIGLSPGQRNALVAFLRALTDERVRNETAPFDRPTLYMESNNRPVPYGTGTPGTNGFVPRLVALEPPRIGNDNMTIGVEHGFGGHQAILALSPSQDFGGTVFQGATLHIGLTGGVQLHRIPHLNGSTPGTGFSSVNIEVPLDPVLIGTSVFAQWFVLDLGAPVRFSATDAVEITFY
jgi:cytochrome c peroxidase